MTAESPVAHCVLDSILKGCLAGGSLNHIKAFAMDYQGKKFLSKFVGAGGLGAHQRALEKFLTNCIRVKHFEIVAREPGDAEYLSAYQRRTELFFSGIPIDDLSLPSLHRRGGVGPGKSVKSFGTDFLRKLYYGPTSATSVDVLHSYIRGCVSNPTDLKAAICGLQVYGCHVEDSSRLSFVEKNVDEARTIATEPSVNMFFQLALGEVIHQRLRTVYRLDKRDTPLLNRFLCRLGSYNGSYATIDLSSASDSISKQLVKFSVPEFFSSYLERYRCEYSKLPDGRILKLPMISTMGNGWTFYLMTALLYCALHAVCDVEGRSTDVFGSSVWGDDIVLPTRYFGGMCRLLALLGFVVNREKSFNEGPFRESCGHDFYHGHFVRPVFLRRFDTQDSHYVAANRLAEWGAFHSVDVTPCLKYIISRIAEPLRVPRHEPMSSGLRVPLHLSRSKIDKNGSRRYKALIAVPLTYDVSDDPQRARTLSPSINPDGVMVALVGGFLRAGRISERSNTKVRWRLTRRLSPHWNLRDDVPNPGWGRIAEERWETLLEATVS